MKYPTDGLVFQRHQVSDTRFQQEIPVSGKPNTYVSLVPLLSGEVDSSLNDARKGKSTLGQVSFFMGNLMDCRSSTSSRVAGSSAEAEAMSLLASGRVDVWDEMTKRFEASLIQTALAHTRGRRIDAAHKLGIGRNTITRKIQELGLE